MATGSRRMMNRASMLALGGGGCESLKGIRGIMVEPAFKRLVHCFSVFVLNCIIYQVICP